MIQQPAPHAATHRVSGPMDLVYYLGEARPCPVTFNIPDLGEHTFTVVSNGKSKTVNGTVQIRHTLPIIILNTQMDNREVCPQVTLVK